MCHCFTISLFFVLFYTKNYLTILHLIIIVQTYENLRKPNNQLDNSTETKFIKYEVVKNFTKRRNTPTICITGKNSKIKFSRNYCLKYCLKRSTRNVSNEDYSALRKRRYTHMTWTKLNQDSNIWTIALLMYAIHSSTKTFLLDFLLNKTFGEYCFKFRENYMVTFFKSLNSFIPTVKLWFKRTHCIWVTSLDGKRRIIFRWVDYPIDENVNIYSELLIHSVPRMSYLVRQILNERKNSILWS